MDVSIREVPAVKVHPLRHVVLRAGQEFSQAIFPGDEAPDTAHFGAYHCGALVGIASVYHEQSPADTTADAWRVRGMATILEFRRCGIGGQLLDAIIAHVRSLAGDVLWCNARTPAVPFYERRGFVIIGSEFDLPRIGPHYLMQKRMH